MPVSSNVDSSTGASAPVEQVPPENPGQALANGMINTVRPRRRSSRRRSPATSSTRQLAAAVRHQHRTDGGRRGAVPLHATRNPVPARPLPAAIPGTGAPVSPLATHAMTELATTEEPGHLLGNARAPFARQGLHISGVALACGDFSGGCASSWKSRSASAATSWASIDIVSIRLTGPPEAPKLNQLADLHNHGALILGPFIDYRRQPGRRPAPAPWLVAPAAATPSPSLPARSSPPAPIPACTSRRSAAPSPAASPACRQSPSPSPEAPTMLLLPPRLLGPWPIVVVP
jgi:hypothetical protein